MPGMFRLKWILGMAAAVHTSGAATSAKRSRTHRQGQSGNPHQQQAAAAAGRWPPPALTQPGGTFHNDGYRWAAASPRLAADRSAPAEIAAAAVIIACGSHPNEGGCRRSKLPTRSALVR